MQAKLPQKIAAILALTSLGVGPVFAQGTSFTAQGNEPFWSATVADDMMTVRRLDFDDLSLAIVGDTTATSVSGRQLTILGAADPDTSLQAFLLIAPGICHDTMSGMPFPAAAELALGDSLLIGCAGDPEQLLIGGEWIVEDIAGLGVLDNVQVSLSFDGEGNISGSGGCNRLIAGYTMTGEGVDIANDIATTMMACPDAVMTQERAFLRTLGQTVRFDIDATGALILFGPDGAAAVTARRAGG